MANDLNKYEKPAVSIIIPSKNDNRMHHVHHLHYDSNSKTIITIPDMSEFKVYFNGQNISIPQLFLKDKSIILSFISINENNGKIDNQLACTHCNLRNSVKKARYLLEPEIQRIDLIINTLQEQNTQLRNQKTNIEQIIQDNNITISKCTNFKKQLQNHINHIQNHDQNQHK